jgi:hypothetical protein
LQDLIKAFAAILLANLGFPSPLLLEIPLDAKPFIVTLGWLIDSTARHEAGRHDC